MRKPPSLSVPPRLRASALGLIGSLSCTTAALASKNENNGSLTRASLEDISASRDPFRVNLPWEVMLIILGLLVLLIALLSIRRWWGRRNTDPTPLMIYSAIARKAGLSFGDRVLLWRIARKRELATPITLLLARGALDHHAKAYRAALSHSASGRVGRRIDRIRGELFGP